MRSIKRLHLYLGCFFSPLLLFYVLTGWYQSVNTNRNKTVGELGGWRERLTSIHVDQVFPVESANAFSPALFRGLVVAMSVALVITIGLGIYLAFKTSRSKWPVWGALGLGIVVPVILLWLGQIRE